MGGLFAFFRRWRRRPPVSAAPGEVIFFGLGNPGERYRRTRHNIGFRVVDAFIETLTERTDVSFPEAEMVSGKTGTGRLVATVKPLTFMNHSGDAVAAVLKKWDIPLARCFVIVDDLNLPLGTVRVRRSGSDGGHNGLKSIIARVGHDFPRLRIGIGPVPANTEVIDFVLGAFAQTEEKELEKIQKTGIDILTAFTVDTIDAVMNTFN
jgi:PTH1 family peptidyl-tRNA hydrolase